MNFIYLGCLKLKIWPKFFNFFGRIFFENQIFRKRKYFGKKFFEIDFKMTFESLLCWCHVLISSIKKIFATTENIIFFQIEVHSFLYKS